MKTESQSKNVTRPKDEIWQVAAIDLSFERLRGYGFQLLSSDPRKKNCPIELLLPTCIFSSLISWSFMQVDKFNREYGTLTFSRSIHFWNINIFSFSVFRCVCKHTLFVVISAAATNSQ